MRSTLIPLALAAALSACAAPRPMSDEEARARDECELEAAKVGSVDWMDAALRRGAVRTRCLRLKGY